MKTFCPNCEEETESTFNCEVYSCNKCGEDYASYEKQKINNELLNDCAWFAEKHRGKNKLSGAHWSTIIRFTPLFDEAVRLQKRVDTLESYISDFTPDSMTITRLTARVKELEDANRWIPVSERLPEEDSYELWGTYLCKINWYGEIKIAPLWFSYGGWYTGYSSTASNYSDKVTHWRPLPELPTKAGE